MAGGLSGWLRRDPGIIGRILLVGGGLLLLTSSTWYILIAGFALGGIELLRETLFLHHAKSGS
jgi:hypothetical protein